MLNQKLHLCNQSVKTFSGVPLNTIYIRLKHLKLPLSKYFQFLLFLLCDTSGGINVINDHCHCTYSDPGRLIGSGILELESELCIISDKSIDKTPSSLKRLEIL